MLVGLGVRSSDFSSATHLTRHLACFTQNALQSSTCKFLLSCTFSSPGTYAFCALLLRIRFRRPHTLPSSFFCPAIKRNLSRLPPHGQRTAPATKASLDVSISDRSWKPYTYKASNSTGLNLLPIEPLQTTHHASSLTPNRTCPPPSPPPQHTY